MTTLSYLGEAALETISIGWPVFPCVPRGKAPLGAAVPRGFKDASTDPDQIRRWWTRWPDANLAVACGSPGPDVLDIDTKDGRSGRELFQQAWRAGLLRGWTAQIITPSGGRHFWYAGTDQRGGAVGKDKALELKATGGYVLLPPSFVESTDYRYADSYRVLEYGNNADAIDWTAVKALLDPAPRPVHILRPRPVGDDDRPGDAFNATARWSDILTPHGWAFLRQHGRISYWRRPDKTEGQSATTNALGTDRLKVFSSSTCFDPNETYSKFAAYTLLNFGENAWESATRELRSLGYGRHKVAA
jgi:hypothetical protein